jgi:hypothetical protein
MDLSIHGEAYKAAVQAFVMAGATSSEARNASSWPRDNGWFKTRVGATTFRVQVKPRGSFLVDVGPVERSPAPIALCVA